MQVYNIKDLAVFHSVFEFINSNMYLIIEQNEAIIVDPHKSDEIDLLLKENNVNKVMILLTHEHTDHITGINWLKKNFDTTIFCSKFTAKHISNKKNTRPVFITFILKQQDMLNGTHKLENFTKEYDPIGVDADIIFDKEYFFKWKSHVFNFTLTPGHSRGSCCIIMDNKIIFTGDSLIKNIATITRFPTGNEKDFRNITIPFLKALPSKLIVLPGHGESFKVEEIKEFLYC